MELTMLEYTLDQLKKLIAIPSPSGYTTRVANALMEELRSLGYAPLQTAKGGILVDLGGTDRENALLLSGHVDTLGGMVACVKDSGTLRITPLGGLRPNNTEGENVTIITRSGKAYSGTFQLENASVHVNNDYATTKRDFDTMEVVVDEPVASREAVQSLGIETGDIVAFDPRLTITPSGYIKSRFLDDKLSCAILLALAKGLRDAGKVPARQLYLYFTVYEEVGHGAAAGIPGNVTEMVSVDMGCVGAGLTCTEREVSICVKDSSGPSSYEVVSALVDTAKAKGVSYALDIYPRYGSDADCSLRAGHDVRHCVMGPGVYASHGYERSHVDGVKNTYDLLEAYVELPYGLLTES